MITEKYNAELNDLRERTGTLLKIVVISTQRERAAVSQLLSTTKPDKIML